MPCEPFFRRTIRHTISILVFLVFLWVPLSTGQAQQSDQVRTQKNFLWSVHKEGKTIFVLGSVHVLKPGYGPLPQEMEIAYERSKTLVFETDIDRASSQEVQARMMALGLYPEGETLEDNISEETHDLLKIKAAQVGLPVPYIRRFRPWLCALTLSVMELQRLGFSEEHGLDRYFFNRCKNDGKEIKTLEPVEYQIDLLAEMDESQQEAFLNQTLKDLEVIEAMAVEMVEAWEHGDVEKLRSIIEISLKDHPDLYDLFFARRNRKWVSQLEDMAQDEEPLLVIVGAGHLVGENNMIRGFQGKGYEVEQR